MNDSKRIHQDKSEKKTYQSRDEQSGPEGKERSRGVFQAHHPVDDNREDGALEQEDGEIGRDLRQAERSRVVHGKGLVLGQDRTTAEGLDDLGHGGERVVHQ